MELTAQNISVVERIICSEKGADFKFSPTIGFYTQTQINSKRFAKMLRGEISPTLAEFQSICNYFKRDPKEFI